MHLPGPLRAAVGLIATAAAEVRQLPDRAIELPMLAVSSALQASLRTQQRYARLAARGDDVLNRRRPTSEPPPWATFDEPVPVEDLRRAALAELNRFGAGHDPLPFGEPNEAPAETTPAKAPATKAAATKAPAKKAASNRAPAKKAPAKKAPAKKASATKATADSAPAEKATAEKATAEKATAENAAAPVAKAADDAGEGKSVSKPRHTAPSRFDDAGD